MLQFNLATRYSLINDSMDKSTKDAVLQLITTNTTECTDLMCCTFQVVWTHELIRYTENQYRIYTSFNNTKDKKIIPTSFRNYKIESSILSTFKLAVLLNILRIIPLTMHACKLIFGDIPQHV